MIIRLSKSGKGFQVVDGDGNVFITSVEYLKRLLDGRYSGPFVLLTRLPNPVAVDRFPASPVWNPVSGTSDSDVQVGQELSAPLTTNDAFSVNVLKKKVDVPIVDVVL